MNTPIMNRENAKNITKLVEQLLAKLPPEYAGKVDGGITFDPLAGTVRMRIVIGTKQDPTNPADYKWTPEYQELLKGIYLGLIDLKEEMLDKTFDIPSIGPAHLVGYNWKAPKYPFIVAPVNNPSKHYRITERSLRFAVRISTIDKA